MSDSRLTDFDLHGLAGVRLVDAGPAETAAVRAQLGLSPGTLEREPDIVVRFVDELRIVGPLRYLGLNEAAFEDDAFLVLRGRHKSRARVRVPFEQLGRRTELVCERGLAAVPLLIPILNLTVLANGALPLHASAFVYRGTGVVATGWSKGGKTEALLAFACRGAEYVGDEWVYIGDEGRQVFGIPEPIRLWDWHLRQLPEYRRRVTRAERARLHTLALLQAAGAVAPQRKAVRRVLPLLRRQSFVDVEPGRLFAQKPGKLAAPFDRLFFVASHESSEIRVREIEPEEVARRMVFSLAHERLDFQAFYLAFRFAFPDRASEVVERATELERAALDRLLAGKPAFEVLHPYPVSLDGLFEAMRPYC